MQLCSQMELEREMITHEQHMYNVSVCERAPPVAVPAIVSKVTTTSLASVPLWTDTLTDLETVLSVSLKV